MYFVYFVCVLNRLEERLCETPMVSASNGQKTEEDWSGTVHINLFMLNLKYLKCYVN